MKKFLSLDFILGVVLFVGMTVVSVAFVHYSYAWADEYPKWLEHAMRIVGFIGTVFFPVRLATGVQSWIEETEEEEFYNL